MRPVPVFLTGARQMRRRRWTRAQIIAEIIDLHEAGEPLTVANMRRLGYGGMVAAAYRQQSLGSWPAAHVDS